MTNFLNEYSYNDIFIGQKESFVIKITESMVQTFGNFSGDLNPLHMDTKFAESSSFKKIEDTLLSGGYRLLALDRRLNIFENKKFYFNALYASQKIYKKIIN